MGMSSMFWGMAPAAVVVPRRLGQLLARRGEQAELRDEALGRSREGLLGRDGAVRLDLDGQLVVVGHLADAGVLHVVVDLAHGREDGVHRDDPDGHLLGALRGEVAHAALDREVQLDGHPIGVEGHQLLLGVDGLDIRGFDDVGGGHRARPVLDQLQLDRSRGVALEPKLLTLSTICVRSSLTPAMLANSW